MTILKDEKPYNSEPTITDVMGVVRDLAVSVQDLTEAVQSGFGKMENRSEKVENKLVRHENILTTLVEGQQNLREILNERTDGLDKRMSKVQNRVEDVVDVLEKAAKKMPSFDVTQLLYENK